MSKYSGIISIGSSVIIDNTRKHRAYETILDPVIPNSNDDYYVVTVVGDRLDRLAFQFYQDPTYWWIISAANPELRKDSMCLEPGIQLRIPTDLVAITQLLSTYNLSR